MSMQVGNSWRITAGLLTTVLATRHRTAMKTFIIAMVTLGATVLASPAMAYVVEVMTSIDVTDVADTAGLRKAVESAVDDVLANAISLSPTLVTVQNARVLGNRMYLLLLIADAAGEKTLETMARAGAASQDSERAVEPMTPRSTR